VLPDFFNIRDSLNLVTNAISCGTVGGMVQEKGSRECCSSWTLLHTQRYSALSSGFPVSQGRPNAEALDRWGEKRKHYLISYFFGNTSAKMYRNRIMYVKIIASQRHGCKNEVERFRKSANVFGLFWSYSPWAQAKRRGWKRNKITCIWGARGQHSRKFIRGDSM